MINQLAAQEKSDPAWPSSPPKKQIVWWIEDNVPVEFRPYVQQGILEWNKAFEKIGILDAVAVRWQNERDDFEPEDINYCTLRWITTGSTFAMSAAVRSDPMTGEMIDCGDVIYDASWIKTWKEEYTLLVGVPTPTGTGSDSFNGMIPLAMGEVISPIMAMKQGFGLPTPLREAAAPAFAQCKPCFWEPRRPTRPHRGRDGPHGPRRGPVRLGPDSGSPLPSDERGPVHIVQLHGRQVRRGDVLSASLALGMMADAEKDKDKKDKETKLPEEFLGQAIKEVVMHEVGHSLASAPTIFKAKHHAPAGPDQRHVDHPREGHDRQRHGLQPDPASRPRARSRATTPRPRSGLTITGPSNTPTSRSTETKPPSSRRSPPSRQTPTSRSAPTTTSGTTTPRSIPTT